MKLQTIQDVFEDELFDMYNAEVQLTKELPKLVEKATSGDLIEALRHHLEETEVQVDRLEKAVDILGIRIEKEKCEAMAGLIKETERLVKSAHKGTVMDAVLITALRKIEHYEMASYGSLSALAKLLGYEDVAALLDETYDEEKGADDELSALAEAHINKDAMTRMAAE